MGLTASGERRRRLLFAAAAALSLLAAGALGPNRASRTLSHALLDARFSLTSRAASGRVLIAAIDEASLRAIGTWPWPRSVYAAVITTLKHDGARRIGFDIDFSSHSAAAQDAALAAALRLAGGKIILAAERAPDAADRLKLRLVAPIHPFAAWARQALVDVRTNARGTVRQLAYGARAGGRWLPGFAPALAGQGVRRRGWFSPDFGIDARTIPVVSVADLLDGRIGRATIAGRRVIVGATAFSLRDFFTVPRFGTISGARLLALGADSLAAGRALARAPPFTRPLGCAVLALLVFAAGALLPLWPALSVLALASGGAEAGAMALQTLRPILLDTGGWQIGLWGAMLALLAGEWVERRLRWRRAAREKAETQAILDRVFIDSRSAILVVDWERRIRVASDAALAAFGMPPLAEVLGRPLAASVPAAVDALFGPAGTMTGAESGQFELPGAGGETRVFAFSLSISVLRPEARGGRCGVALCLSATDISERLAAERRIARMALVDSMSGLPNRNGFYEYFAGLEETAGLALLLVDIDHMRALNDGFGPRWGDALVAHLGRLIGAMAGRGAFVARLAGDEFAVLTGAGAQACAERIGAGLRAPVALLGREALVSVAIGWVALDGVGSVEEAMRRANIALAAAKAQRPGAIAAYEPRLEQTIAARAALEAELRRALEREEFEVFYQPQARCADRRIIGAEALIRWRHPSRGLVAPGAFIGALEESGLVVAAGRWILEQACREAAGWPEDVHVAVNVAPAQLFSGELPRIVAEVLARTGLAAGRLDLELTESAFIAEDGKIGQQLAQFRGLGVGLALDDFGTGYSSLGYIKRFPVSKIKIDQSFVRDLPDDEESAAIVSAITAVARALKLVVLAEGTETEAQLRALQRLGCPEVQGYLIGRPMPAADFAARIARAEIGGRVVAGAL